MDPWIGKRVSLNCGALGFFQGIVKRINLEESAITLGGDVFENGVASKSPEVTLQSSDITKIKILEQNPDIDISLNLIPKADFSSFKKNRSLPINFQHGPHYSLMDNCNSKFGEEYKKSKDNECFGTDVFNMQEEFDFEKNLLLFDKRLIFSQLDEELRLSSWKNDEPSKYRNDENVLGTLSAKCICIKTKNVLAEYVTDSGLVVPAIDTQTRFQIHESLETFKFSMDKSTESFARAIADIALQAIGGSHRLNPSNAHQFPTAVILCGLGQSGSNGMAVARILVSHGVKTIVYNPNHQQENHVQFMTEKRLYQLTGQKQTTETKDLPQELSKIDIVINALENFETPKRSRNEHWYEEACHWINYHLDPRTPILSVDPPPRQKGPFNFPAKITVVPGLLPFSFSERLLGKLYMVNLGIPDIVFKRVGICFSSPFGAKSAIQLHPK